MKTETLQEQAARLGIELRPGRGTPETYWDRFEPDPPRSEPTIPQKCVESAYSDKPELRPRERALAEAQEPSDCDRDGLCYYHAKVERGLIGDPSGYGEPKRDPEEWERHGGGDQRAVPLPADELLAAEPFWDPSHSEDSPTEVALAAGFAVFLDKLTVRQQETIRAGYFAALPEEQAAAKLGISRSGYRRNRDGALAALGRLLGESFLDAPYVKHRIPAPVRRPRPEPEPETLAGPVRVSQGGTRSSSRPTRRTSFETSSDLSHDVSRSGRRAWLAGTKPRTPSSGAGPNAGTTTRPASTTRRSWKRSPTTRGWTRYRLRVARSGNAPALGDWSSSSGLRPIREMTGDAGGFGSRRSPSFRTDLDRTTSHGLDGLIYALASLDAGALSSLSLPRRKAKEMATKAFQELDDLSYAEWADVSASKWKTLTADEAKRLQRQIDAPGIVPPGGEVGEAGGPLPYWESLQSPRAAPTVAGRTRKKRKTPRPERLPRITRQEDTKEALVELVKWAMKDPDIRPNDLAVLKALVDNGIGRTSIEVMASRDWIAEVTDLSPKSVRWALERLGRLGYLKRITRAEVSRHFLRHYLDRQPRREGRPISLFRLSTDRPDWQSIPDFGNPVLGELDRLLAAS